MNTGIVFRLDGRKAVVLKGDGAFVSVRARSGWRVGETVLIPTAARGRVKPFLAMAACFAAIVFGGWGGLRLYTAPVSLISLDVNPSIELGVNRWGRVISATARNEEGVQILSEADTENAAYQDALSSILNAEAEGGYLTTGADVVLTVFSRDTAVQSSLLSELQSVVDSKISGYSDQITAEYHAVDERTVNGAHGHGVTAGKYLYLQELQVLAPETDLSQYTHHSIEQIKGEIATCRQEHGGGEEDVPHGGTHGEAACD